MSKYDLDMERLPANHVPLTPLSFLQRTAAVYPERCAIRYGEKERTWAETFGRCRALADALRRRGVQKNDTVAVASTLAATLEMSRRGQLRIRQDGPFQPIYLHRDPDYRSEQS